MKTKSATIIGLMIMLTVATTTATQPDTIGSTELEEIELIPYSEGTTLMSELWNMAAAFPNAIATVGVEFAQTVPEDDNNIKTTEEQELEETLESEGIIPYAETDSIQGIIWNTGSTIVNYFYLVTKEVFMT